MILFACAFTVIHLYIAGLLSSAILTNRAEGRSSAWTLWTCAPINFAFGIYYLFVVVGKAAAL